jgi:hypothetical protein
MIDVRCDVYDCIHNQNNKCTGHSIQVWELYDNDREYECDYEVSEDRSIKMIKERKDD